MGARLRPHLPALAGALLGAAVLAWLGLYGFAWSDYDNEASAAFKALADGHVQRFLQLCPSYGGSMILRAPFAAVPMLWGGGELAVFRAEALPCIAAAVALAVWLAARMRADGHSTLSRATAVALCACSPIAVRALEIGHPEELLGAVLCVAAVLAAARGRLTWAGVLLGVAIATKAWAVLAVGPVLLALPARHWRTLLVTGAVAAVVLSPLALAGHQQFKATTGSIAQTGNIFTPPQVWWFFGEHGIVRGGDGQLKPGFRVSPPWLTSVTHPLIVLLAVPLTLLAFLRRRRGHNADPLLLLALLLHLRCVLDAWNNVYYPLPFLLALLAWETHSRRRPPVWTLLATLAIGMFFSRVPGRLSADGEALLYIALAVPAAAALAVELYAPQLWDRVGVRLRLRSPRAVATNVGPA